MPRTKLAALLFLLTASLGFMAEAQNRQDRQLVDPARAVVSSQFALAQPISTNLATATDPNTTTGESSSRKGFIRAVPPPRAVKQLPSQKPFRTVAFGIKANTLGAGAELATPLSRVFNLRSGFNFLIFGDPFNIDGVSYNAQLHFRSSQTTLDWFPTGRTFHISPGILYSRNTVGSTAAVPAGQNFTLGDQTYLNSVDDPVSGTMSVVYPRKVSPMLLMGFGNILPRSSRHLSIPVEFGVAYTGAATINVNLTGTSCITQGCVSFANNAAAQATLKQEVQILNEDLKKLPVYPILSLGVAYHF